MEKQNLEQKLDRPKSRILIVDDFSPDRTIAKIFLGDKYLLHLTDNAESALEILKSKSYKFSAIISDYRMQKMNGIELYDHISKDNDLCYLTDHFLLVSTDKPKEADEKGIMFMAKGFDENDFVSKVEEILGGKYGRP